MTRAELVKILNEDIGLPKGDARKSIELIIEIIKETLAEGESVKITGFGTFNVKKKHARRGRNPQTGEDLEISARRVVTFTPSSILKAAIE